MRNVTHLSVAVAACAGAACSSGGNSTIIGTAMVTYVSITGTTTDFPVDLTGTTYQAFFPTGTTGFKRYPSGGPVMGTKSGQLEIEDAPTGSFILKATSGDSVSWEAHATNNISSDTLAIGRIDAVASAQTTPLTISATGMDAWAAGDQLVANCFNNGTENIALASELSPAPAAGDVAINAPFDWNNTDPMMTSTFSYTPSRAPRLLDAARGDALVVSRIAHAQLDAQTAVDTLTQTLDVSDVTQTDGGSATATGAFTEVALTNKFPLQVDQASFASAIGTATNPSWSIVLDTSPGAVAGALFGPNLIAVSQLNSPLNGNYTASPMFGNPFGTTWPVLLSAALTAERAIVMPGATPSSLAMAFGEVGYLPTGTYEFKPTSPPSSPTINGTSIDEHYITWDGTSPITLAVTVPIGATGFNAVVSKIEVVGGATVLTPVMSIGASDASITLPAEAFTAGTYYAMQITSSVSPTTTTETATYASGKFVLGPASASKCGDGVIDSATGETCDDGNTVDGDGCSSTCH